MPGLEAFASLVDLRYAFASATLAPESDSPKKEMRASLSVTVSSDDDAPPSKRCLISLRQEAGHPHGRLAVESTAEYDVDPEHAAEFDDRPRVVEFANEHVIEMLVRHNRTMLSILSGLVLNGQQFPMLEHGLIRFNAEDLSVSDEP